MGECHSKERCIDVTGTEVAAVRILCPDGPGPSHNVETASTQDELCFKLAPSLLVCLVMPPTSRWGPLRLLRLPSSSAASAVSAAAVPPSRSFCCHDAAALSTSSGPAGEIF